ncbi:MAG: hypothetical protein ACI3Z0_00045, partial [Candidatus Cryptobacteroides sp.]
AFTPEKKEIYDQDMKNEQDIEYEKSICYNEGREEGLAEGRKEGREEGEQIGEKRGREEGRRENALSAAKNLLAEGISPETVARCVGISLEEVKALKEKLL